MAAIFLFALLAINISCILADPVVETCEGSLRGTVLKASNGRKINSFLGVPYARPPIGKLRFSDPVPKEPWHGILNAQTEGEECTQISGDSIKGSEDCLSLNTYTPTLNKNASLPVMIFIHGGTFIRRNSSRILYGPDYLLVKNVVLVTCNYRLGIFGFASTGDRAITGNFGLKDQVLVLKWVKRNIRAFGGNPNDVTLFGQSAGSVCTHLHAFSEQSKDLFNRYILESGLATSKWGFRSHPSYYDKVKKAGEMYNCPTKNTHSLVACLRKLSASQLVRTDSVFTEVEQLLMLMWAPTIEAESKTAFITDTPTNLLQQNKLKNSSLMSGVCRNEGLIGTAVLYTNETMYNIFASYPEYIISQMLQHTGVYNESETTKLAIKIKNFYWGTEMPKDKDKVIEGYTNLVTDLYFFYPNVKFIYVVSVTFKLPTYSYLFNYRGSYSWTSDITHNNKDLGITHGDPDIYLFPQSSTDLGLPYNVEQTRCDLKIRNVMVDMYTSFACNGVPVSNHLSDPSLWPPYGDDLKYLTIGNFSKPVVFTHSYFFEDRLWFVQQELDEVSV